LDTSPLSRRPGQVGDRWNSPPKLTGRGRKLAVFIVAKYEGLASVSWLHSLCSLRVYPPSSFSPCAVVESAAVEQCAGYEICPLQAL